MTTVDFIIALFWRVDDAMPAIPKHPQAKLYPSEVVTLGILFALKGVGERAFYRWLVRDYRQLFPHLPERTRLFRLMATHQDWSRQLLATPTVLGIVDNYGIELLHPIREGRHPGQLGKKGLSNHRLIVGGKLCLLVNQYGQVVAWDCATANVHDTAFGPLIQQYDGRMIVLADHGFHAAGGDPPHLKLCPRGQWNERMVIETILGLLTVVCHSKHQRHRVWQYFQAHLAFLLVMYNVLVQWDGLKLDEEGHIRLSIAVFSL